jgi:hypothetical protein
LIPSNKKIKPTPAKSKSMKLTTFSSSPLLSKGFGFLKTSFTMHETVFGISFLSIFKQHFNHFLVFYPTMGAIRVPKQTFQIKVLSWIPPSTLIFQPLRANSPLPKSAILYRSYQKLIPLMRKFGGTWRSLRAQSSSPTCRPTEEADKGAHGTLNLGQGSTSLHF